MKLTTLVLLASTALPLGIAQAQTAPPATPPAAASTQALAAQDFVNKAANSDMFEIESSKLAQQKSQNNRVREFADMMIKDHTQASEKLKSAAQGLNVPSSPDQQHAQMVQQLQGANGPDFDRRYVQMQLSGHEDAVKLFDQYSQNGDKTELKQFAQQTLPTLREHLQHVQQLRSQLPPDQTAQNQSGQSASPATAPRPAAANANASASAAGVKFVETRPQDQFRASKLIGTRVYGANDEHVGEINDVLMDKSGRIHAVVLGVGGFLGIGEKDVAVPMDALKFTAETRTAARTTTTGAVTSPNAGANNSAPPPANANPNASANAPAGTTRTDTARANDDDDGVPDRIVLSLSKEQLHNAPKFVDKRK